MGLKQLKHIAIYGGTFCPIHNAHLKIACFLQNKFKFDEFRFLPNKAPVLDKTPETSLKHRLAMLALALASYPQFKMDMHEVERPTPSFMIQTLEDIQKEETDGVVISLILGMDSFNNLHRWREWEKIMTLCNLIVIERPDCEAMLFASPLQDKIDSGQLNEITDAALLSLEANGGFFRCNAGWYAISSTTIRECIQTGQDASAYLPTPVWNYIMSHNLFGYSGNKGESSKSP